MPEVLKHEIHEANEEEWNSVMNAVEQALSEMQSFRNQEGKMLQDLFVEKLIVFAILVEIEPYESERIEKVKERIIESLQKIEDFDYDKNRFEQEMIYHVERLDINEEKAV